MAEIPDWMKSRLRTIIGDMKLFDKNWPLELLGQFIVISNQIGEYDKKLQERLTVLSLAVLPPMEGETLPEGLTWETVGKVAQGMMEGILRDLGQFTQ